MGTLGSVTTRFVADTTSAEAAITKIGKVYAETGTAAEKMAAKIQAAAAVEERAAQVRERSVEKWRRAFERDQFDQMHASIASDQFARAQQMAALKADILARSVDGAAQSVERFGRAAEGSVPKTAAASAAIRVMEGRLGNNVRAAERFIGTLPGMSTLLMAAFPAVGAIALAGVIGELIGRAAKFAGDARELSNELGIGWLDGAVGQLDGLKEAAQQADSVLLDLARDADQLKSHAREMEIDTIRKVQGPAAAFRAQAADKAKYAGDQQKILAPIGTERQGLEAQLDPQATHSSGNPYLATTNDREKAKARIKELDAQIANIQMHIKDAQQEAQGFELDAKAADDKKGAHSQLEAFRKQAEAQREIISAFLAGSIEDFKRAESEAARATEEIQAFGVKGLEEQDKGRREDEERQRKQRADEIEELRKHAEQVTAIQKGVRTGAGSGFQQVSDNTAFQVATGQMSPSQRTRELEAALTKEHEIESQSLDAEMDLYNEGSADYQRVLDERLKLDEEYAKKGSELQRQAAQEGFAGAFIDIQKRWTDWASDFKQTLEQTLSSVNGELVRMMTTQYHRGDWKNATKPIFTGIASKGLEGAEGSIMKAFGLGGKGKLGEKGNPMYVKSADPLGGSGSGSGAGASPFAALQSGGDGSGSSGVGSLLGILAKAGIFAGFMADGGLMSPGGFYLTGEHGPELINVGSTSRIHNARDTARSMGGGGDTHHTWNIDARGSNDPAAVRRAVQAGIMEAAPHIAAGAIVAQKDMNSRRPGGRA